MTHGNVPPNNAPDPAAGEELRVLILEDVPRDADLNERELRRAGIRFMARRVDTREAFLAALGEFRPDILLSDYQLPRFDGMEALRLLLEHAPGVPDIIVTGSINEETAVDCIKAGAADYVTKQHLVRLGPAVRGALDTARIRRAKEAADLEVRLAAREWRTTFDAITDAICLLDLEQKVQRCNRAFHDLVGKDWSEILGRPCYELLRETDRPIEGCQFAAAVRDRCSSSMELTVGDKIFRVSVDPILDEDHVVTGCVQVMTDITEQKRAQRVVELRLELIQFAACHTLDELLSKALDKIGGLVDSPIGFYHFVEPDQETLSLQQWSTRTLKEFCQAEGKGLHYPIERAGVWADCARERKPIVHNDYESLKHKNGIPASHAAVIRELVVPVMRNDKVVAILGVGNKPAEYTEDDVKIVSYLSDVTWEIVERKRVEEALRKSEMTYRTLVENIPQKIFMKDRESRYLSLNANFARDLGIRPEDAVGKVDYDFFPKDLAEKYRGDDRRVMETGRTEEIEEKYTREGREAWVYTVKAPVRDAHGETVGVLGVFWDITERKQAEAERERLMTAIEQAAEVVFITDPAGAIQYVNPAFERVTGYTTAESIGQNARILKSGVQDAAFYRGLWETISGGGTWDGRIVNKRKDGTLYTEETTISPVRDASGRIANYVAVKHDITRDLELQQQLRQAQKMEAVGQLAGGVAHDFNNILQAMVGYCSMLLDRLPEHDEAHEFAEEIILGAERAAALTRQLLTFSRRQILEMEDVDLNDVVRGLTKMIRRIISEDVEVKVMENRRLDIVHANPGQMEQVLLNLCINARDAMPKGGALRIETENVVMDSEYCEAHAWASPGRYVLLSVTDTGCGMDAETQARIFEPFFTTKELGKGTGLGLATVYGIVRQHQGMVQVYSEVGKGTTFKVYLPSFGRAAATVGTKVIERARGGTETILVAEDDEVLRKLAARILESAGYTVLLAAHGKEALDVFRPHAADIHLILADVVMPKMGGRSVYDALRGQYPNLRFLFSSGYSTNAIHTGFVLEKGLELIQKPYAPDALLRKVREVLDR